MDTWKNMQTRRETLVQGVCVLPEMCLYTRIVWKTRFIFASINGTFGDEIFQSDNTIRQTKSSLQSTTAWKNFCFSILQNQT